MEEEEECSIIPARLMSEALTGNGPTATRATLQAVPAADNEYRT